MTLTALAALTLVVRVAALRLCGFVGFGLHRTVDFVEDTSEEARFWLRFVFG